eukprot:4036237-Amphidinium_carterae.1
MSAGARLPEHLPVFACQQNAHVVHQRPRSKFSDATPEVCQKLINVVVSLAVFHSRHGLENRWMALVPAS